MSTRAEFFQSMYPGLSNGEVIDELIKASIYGFEHGPEVVTISAAEGTHYVPYDAEMRKGFRIMEAARPRQPSRPCFFPAITGRAAYPRRERVPLETARQLDRPGKQMVQAQPEQGRRPR